MANQFNLLCYKELLELEKNNKITFLDLELVTYKASTEKKPKNQQYVINQAKKLFPKNKKVD